MTKHEAFAYLLEAHALTHGYARYVWTKWIYADDTEREQIINEHEQLAEALAATMTPVTEDFRQFSEEIAAAMRGVNQ